MRRMSSGLRGFWQDLSASARAALQPRPGVQDTRPAPPQRLGRYIIDDTLGRGSMGAVYRAHDPQDDRVVAIKTLAWGGEPDDPATAEAHARFVAELQAARRLDHPDIVNLHEAGEEQGIAYLVMEFAPGESLDAYTATDRLLPPLEVLHIIARAADALAYAHRQGVMHRDIKPANIIVHRPTGTVKVTDFGVARLLDAARTRSGTLLGTPAFMAPELLVGRSATARSDVYALGVTLFQLLTGRVPHESSSMAQLMRSIVNEPAPDLRSLRPELGEGIANVVALALERRPELRYPDANALAQDLREVAQQAAAATARTPLGSAGG
jgi:eukaryotic-like serine/threonine-protein kinase